MFRFYSPTAPLFDGTWALPERVDVVTARLIRAGPAVIELLGRWPSRTPVDVTATSRQVLRWPPLSAGAPSQRPRS